MREVDHLAVERAVDQVPERARQEQQHRAAEQALGLGGPRVEAHDQDGRGHARGHEHDAAHVRVELGAEAEEGPGVAGVAELEEAVHHGDDPAAAHVGVGQLLGDLVGQHPADRDRGQHDPPLSVHGSHARPLVGRGLYRESGARARARPMNHGVTQKSL
ncbi:MAG: hypothetical protein M5U28_09015 [Sandaracinaceae bacterium]|nr:hypothetical protein [Sandaracinaceae bacterium]